ncbi:syndetin isoform X1 [Tachysurus ichikawai]
MADMSPVESFRVPSKEELRELREQPIDPQAEQEIIDSIDEVYFSNDSIDMVQYELEHQHSCSPQPNWQLAYSIFVCEPVIDLHFHRTSYLNVQTIHPKLYYQHMLLNKTDLEENTRLASSERSVRHWKNSSHMPQRCFVKRTFNWKYSVKKVSKKVADLILEKQPSYVKELERVTSLQTTLQLAAVICTNARRQLAFAKEGFTEASLGLLANQRRRQLLTGLLKSLRTIKTLQRTDVRLSEMLEEEDYPGAIQLCLECQKAASTFKHYSCISELNSKLQDTLEQIEEQLDVALSKTCKNFDVAHYTRVQLAYSLLGKTQTAMDQLHMHFTQAIHNTVFQVVLGYVELCAGNADTKFQKMQYKDLCTVRPTLHLAASFLLHPRVCKRAQIMCFFTPLKVIS